MPFNEVALEAEAITAQTLVPSAQMRRISPVATVVVLVDPEYVNTIDWPV